MKKEYALYLKKYLKEQSFYIDIVSVILGLVIIILSLVAMIGGRTALLKPVFGLSFVLTAINTYKGFLKGTPTRMIYAGFAAVLAIVWIYSVIRL